jgi:hypothetical protein
VLTPCVKTHMSALAIPLPPEDEAERRAAYEAAVADTIHRHIKKELKAEFESAEIAAALIPALPPISDDTYSFFGRIEDDSDAPFISPHAQIADPCNISTSANPTYAMELIKLHTQFISKTGYTINGPVPVVGDRVQVILDKGDLSYNLQYCYFEEISNTDMRTIENEQGETECTTLEAMFENFDEDTDLSMYAGLNNSGVVNISAVSRPDCATSSDPRCAIIDDRGINDDGEWKVYLVKRNQGVSPTGFWDSFRNALQAHINNVYPEIGMRIENLGVTRDLMASISPSSSGRIAGSKHGAGLAQDVYLHSNLLEGGEYTSYKNDNPVIAKDQRLVNAIINFVAGYPQLRWGGSFGIDGDVVPLDTLPVGRGILEFHHFEFKSAEMPALFAPYADILTGIRGAPGAADITNSTALAQLYTALVKG